MVLFLSFLISVLVSFALMPLLMRCAVHLKMIDEPDERKVHVCAIPRCGGIGLAIGAIVTFLLFIPSDETVNRLILGGSVIVLFGLLDDRFELNYKWKFAGQFLAVVLVISGGNCISFVPFGGLEPAPAYLTLPLTALFVIGVTNAVNLSDGLDGLAAGIMLMTFATIAFLALVVDGQVAAIMSLAVAGGIVGFLWFNTHPAVVFMGDTGSQFIGFMAAFLAIYLTQDVYQTLNPALPLLLLGLPILDTLSVMVRRIRSGRSPFSADKLHIHHRLLNYGFSHSEAVATIYVIQGVFLLAAFNFRYASDFVVLGAYLSISIIILWFFYWAAQRGWSLHALEQQADRRGRGIWRNQRLFYFSRGYLEFSITLFLLFLIASLSSVIVGKSSFAYLIVTGSLLVFLFLPKIIQNILVRMGVYISAVYSTIMVESSPEMSILSHWGVDVFLVVMLFMVSVAVRVTRKTSFRMTAQDVLVVLFVLAAILLVDIEYIGHVIFRLFCLAYALEYLLNRDVFIFRVLRYVAVISGVLVVILVLPEVA